MVERPPTEGSDAPLGRLEEDIRELRAEQKAGVNELRGEMKTSVQELRSEFQTEMKQLRNDFQDSHRELHADIRAMQRNMLFGFFSLAGLFLTYAGFQLS